MSKIKSLIKQNFWGNYLISCYHIVACKVAPALMNDEKAVKRYYKKRFGKELDLSNPQTFAEKINWYKLNSNDPLMVQCADKVAVRDYVKDKGYGDCLNEVYGVYDNVDDIDIDSLPKQFVIKAAHGSHMNYIVKDKDNFDWKHAKLMMKTWLHQDIYWSGREWVYKDIPKRIIVEKYLEDETGELRDFKFFCFHGHIANIEYDAGRFGETHFRNFYDNSSNLLDINDGEFYPDLSLKRVPVNNEVFTRMQELVACLSDSFEHARVDLYCVNNKIYFGEITFFDGGGSTSFKPDKWNYLFSKDWALC
ncbi:MAG: glycosyl transferase [Eubacterium sp.]|nr:glycosyl transferase [Eubacterium sp.]